MSLAISFRRIAQAEFDEAADWYERKQKGRGILFIAEIRNVIDGIRANPETHPVVHGEIREAAVKGYPYSVYYRVEPDQVTVLAIFHQSRDPVIWQSRADSN
jgi:toxin ParE1/3/4